MDRSSDQDVSMIKGTFSGAFLIPGEVDFKSAAFFVPVGHAP
jgi:hypothetical protein